MKRAYLVAAIVVCIIMGALGYLVGTYRGSIDLSGKDDVQDQRIECPVWGLGMFWTYAYDTVDISPTIARTVVATSNATQYQLGIDNRLDAQKHAVLNYNPMLGRITVDNLAVYEKGIPQNIFQFPLKKGSTWTFSLLGRENWDAKVTSIARNAMSKDDGAVIVNIEALSGSGETLSYSFDTEAGWFRSLVLTNADGVEELSMVLVAHGSGFKGTVYFVRGVDLYEKEYSSSTGSPAIDIYDSFMDRGHPNWGPFDYLIYFYEVELGPQSNGLLTIRDHSTTTVLRKVYDPGTSENSLGSLPSSGGEVGLTIVLQGTASLHLMMAGGIEYSWNV